MVLAKKGQAIMVGIMVAVVVFIIAIQLINPLKEMAIDARTDLDCTNSSISTGQQATCIVVDWYMPYLIGMIIATGIGYIVNRRLSVQE